MVIRIPADVILSFQIDCTFAIIYLDAIKIPRVIPIVEYYTITQIFSVSILYTPAGCRHLECVITEGLSGFIIQTELEVLDFKQSSTQVGEHD